MFKSEVWMSTMYNQYLCFAPYNRSTCLIVQVLAVERLSEASTNVFVIPTPLLSR